jgi:hydrogenase maturation protease
LRAPDPEASPETVLILGIGNVLRADAGSGVRCVERLAKGRRLPPAVVAMDGGTPGLCLLPLAANAPTVFDAVGDGLDPGWLVTVAGAKVPRFPGATSLSRHQNGFQAGIATAERLGPSQARMLPIGVQPEGREDFGGGPARQVAARSTARPSIRRTARRWRKRSATASWR